MMKCRSCGGSIASSARRCPHCGNYIWSTGRIGCAGIVLFFFLVLMIHLCQR